MPRSDGASSIFTDRHKQASSPGVINEVYVSAEIDEILSPFLRAFTSTQIIGRVENSEKKQVIMNSEFGEFVYN